MKKILVTGCNGFIGQHVCAHFSAMGDIVCGIDVVEKRETALNRFVQGEITPEALHKLGEPFDVIIHLAGPGTVSAANQEPEMLQKRILNNIRILLDSTRRHPETLLIFPSSAAVYGNQAQAFLAETVPSMPFSQYGCNKVAEENLCEEYHRKYGSRICVIRFFSIYGPGLRKQLLWDFSKRLSEAIQEGKTSVPCFGTGEETRDFIYIDDVVKIFDLFCRKAPDWMVVNAGTGTAHSVRQVLTQLTAAYGITVKLDFDGNIRPGNPMNLVADASKLTACGFIPGVSFDSGLEQYANWAAKELDIKKSERGA